MYRQVQCLYCPSGCRHRLRSRPCTHGPGAAASLQVSTRTRAPFSRAPGLGDTGGRVPSACPTAAPRPPWPAGSPPSRRGCARQGSQATSQLLLSIRGDPRGARHGPRRAGTVGTRGLSLSSGTGGGRRGGGGRRAGSGTQADLQLPCSGTCGSGGGQRALARPPPAMDAVLRRAWPRWELESVSGVGAGPGIPPVPARGTSRRDGDGMGRDGTRWDGVGGAPRGRCHLPPAARPPARRAPAPLKGALRGPAAHGGAAGGSAAENTGTSP